MEARLEEAKEKILTLTFNRPEVLNAVDSEMHTPLALEGLSFKTEDHREAVQAFIEKRKPRFKGR